MFYTTNICRLHSGRRDERFSHAMPVVLLALAGTPGVVLADEPVVAPESQDTITGYMNGPQDLPGIEKGARVRKATDKPEEAKPEEAAPTEKPDWFGGKSWWEWSHVTGNWGGLRTKMEDAGFTLNASLTFDWSSVWSGGVENTAHSRTLWDVNLNVDLEKAVGLTGGTVFVDFQSADGRGGAADAGSFQLFSNIETPGNRDQVSELWYEQKLFDDVLRVKAGKEAADSNFAQLERGNTVLLVGSLSAAAGVLTLSWLLGRAILIPLRQCVVFLRKVAEGDLSGRLNLKSNDEIGELATSADSLAVGLSGIVTNIGKAAESVGAAATEMAAASEEISRSSSEQTDRVERIAAAVEEMAASVAEVAGKSSNAVAGARESGEKATSGGRIVSDAVNEMHAIDKSVTQTAELINDLGSRSQQIGQIIAVIDDIAAQTNLLALNAAIEAARAGEHGRGFAVVADEVRKLADRTTKATEEIAGSINAIREQTARSVEQMQQGSAQVRKGVSQATSAGDSLGEIVQKTAMVSQMVESIAAAAEEQRHAGEEVSRAIQEIAGASRQATDAVSQGAQTAQDLAERATELRSLISRFRTGN